MANAPGTGRQGGRRRRGPPRLATVENVESLTPRMTKITFGGESLAGFGPPRPGAHIKLLFVPPGTEWSPQDEQAPRPPSRTYTPRRYDPETNRLEVEFVHHGDGLAATWAAGAKPGDEIYIGGPGGGYDIAPEATEIVLVADDTALPAVGTILDSLPPHCRATVLCEVADAAEEHALSPNANATLDWIHRDVAGGPPGQPLQNAVRALTARSDTAHWWIACEAAAMRRIRDHLLKERGVDPSRLHTRGYWRLGEFNYPDHDYGDD